jgi:hypothetical protein
MGRETMNRIQREVYDEMRRRFPGGVARGAAVLRRARLFHSTVSWSES